jgi:glycerophosphoryl diester phosphodiesterase
MRPLLLFAALLVSLFAVSSAHAAPKKTAVTAQARAGEPIVIGHRGASGYRPEHTLAAYELAARMGADFIEPDLVSTKDGVLVARHENEISSTTDVAERAEFADRKTTKTIDGSPFSGWFTEDFTLRELKSLRAKERIPQLRPRNTLYDGRYEIPTLTEVISLSRRLSRELDRPIGIYPETKHPTYFQSIGLALEPPLVAALKRHRLNRRSAKVFVQSFETANLKALDSQLAVPLVQLLGAPNSRPYDITAAGGTRTYAQLATRAGLEGIASYADGVGPSKDYILPRDPATGTSLDATTFVEDAHDAGLLVHPYTFRNENTFLPAELRRPAPPETADPASYGDAFAEYERFFELGVDGVFSDNPDTAVEARDGVRR